jgi:hypothetical protein
MDIDKAVYPVEEEGEGRGTRSRNAIKSNLVNYRGLNAFDNMKIFTVPARIAILGMLVSVLHAKDPVLTTPGTANWTTETTATGTRTVFTLTKNTVFNWEELNLESGSEMVFNFTGGKTVVNFLGGTGTHFINGAVTSNGIVAFFSPTADLEVNGSIIAKGVTLATLNADADDFSGENGYKMKGPGGFNYLTVNGRVEATDGDVVLGGERVVIGDTARIQASQDVLIGGGREVSVSASGERRLKEESGFGFVLNLGETRASRIEVAAGREITNQGKLDAGRGRIFLEVGKGGLITNESSGVIVGHGVFNGNFKQNGAVLVPDEGDIAPAINDSTLTLPQLSRPDGTKVSSAPQTISYSTPISASGDAGRDSGDAGKSMNAAGTNMADAGSGTTVPGATSTSPEMVLRGSNGNSTSQTVSYSNPLRAPVSTVKTNDATDNSAVGSTAPATSGATLVTSKSTRVDGTKTSPATQSVTQRVPVSASGGARNDPSYSERADKRVAQNGKSKSLLQRSSFFGMRGGNTMIAKR